MPALFSNYMLISAAIGWAAAQIIKTILSLITTRKFEVERLFGSGGMPSSHSSAVCAFATMAGLTCGMGSFEFGISTLFACVVMYDAVGVRRAVGEHAKHLNTLHEMFSNEKSPEETFKELIGHTPFQVLMGLILGVGSALIVYFIVTA